MALLAALTGCSNGYSVTANGDRSVEARPGEEIALHLVEGGPGCGGQTRVPGRHEWKVTPESGAEIEGGWFVATKPGTYEVTAPMPPDLTEFAEPAVITVTGDMVPEKPADPAAGSEPTAAEPAEPAAAEPEPAEPEPAEKPAIVVDTAVAKRANPSSIELVFAVGNRGRVRGGGKPATFTLNETRRIRLLESYHLAYPGEAPAGGYITLETGDGVVLGPFETNRVEASKSGIPNAYWYADVDFQLPAGVYTFNDSHPRTWTQNAGTKGVGFCGVSAVKK